MRLGSGRRYERTCYGEHVRTVGRLLLGLVVLGLLLGLVTRGRWPRDRLGALLALALTPALLHAAYVTWTSLAIGVDPVWIGLFLGAAVAGVVGAWWYAQRLARERPLSAALVVPGHALAQGLVAGLVERAAVTLGQAFDPMATAAFGGVAVLLGAALLVALPTREHFGWIPRAPRWWVALLRALGKR